MAEWIIGGRHYSIEEYEVYKKQQEEEYNRAQEETRRLVSVLGEAYEACDKFMEAHPRYPYGLQDDAQQREFKIFEKLRQNLEHADSAPRCEKVREDGTVCGCPQMKGYRYYAHERMLQMQSQELDLPSQEDANGIQMAIMRVQKALIDDEISEKKAALLLYSLQMASSNLKHTSFAKAGERAIVEMTEPPRGGTSRVKQANGETQHLTTETQRHGETAVSTQHSAFSQIKGKNLPQMNAEKRRSESALSSQPGATANPVNLPIRLRSGQATDTKEHKGSRKGEILPRICADGRG